jgi:YegS/Rv2252/BmrU family lipid kinase
MRLGEVVAGLERRGCVPVLRRTAGPGDAERLAREAEPEFEAIVAAGGDGTINAVANGLCQNPRPLALLPLGTANVLAHEIGLPRDSDALAELIAAAPARPIWPGRIGGRLFLSIAGGGFDAEIVGAVDPRLKRRIGRFAFILAILACLVRYRGCELSLSVDGVEHRAAAFIAAKGRHYAGPFLLAPNADLTEPALELVLFRDAGRGAALRCLAALPLGRIARLPRVTVLRVRNVLVSALEPVPVQADGEIVGRLPVEIGIAAQPIMLIRP